MLHVVLSVIWFQVGRDLIMGLINGLKHGGQVASAANVVMGAVNAAKMLYIGSPSNYSNNTVYGLWKV